MSTVKEIEAAIGELPRDQFFDLIDDKPAILTFAKRQLQNARKQVAKKAERFLRVHNAGGD